MKIAAVILISIIIVYVLACFSSFKINSASPAIDYAMKQLNLKGIDYKTLIVSATIDVNTSPEKAWEYLVKIDNWKKWQQPLIKSIRSQKNIITKTGDQFEQLLDLGFPLGSVISKETVSVFEPAKILSWKKDEKGIRSCHVWLIKQLNASSVRIYNCEVFYGSSMAYIKMLVHNKWNHLFMQSVLALKTALEKQ